MNHKTGFNALSKTSSHRRAMSRNMVTSLFRYERITTTKAKALEVRKAAEKLITRGKVDTVHNRRQVARFIQDKIVLNKLFTVIAPRMKERHGGYTRVLKIGFRQGDTAEMVILELVDYKLDLGDSTEKVSKAESVAPPKAETTEKKATKAKATTEKAPSKAKSVKASATTAKTAKKGSASTETDNTDQKEKKADA
ncbi:MAG: 50S ribosomal protein L17 [Treponemataceae bacterium]